MPPTRDADVAQRWTTVCDKAATISHLRDVAQWTAWKGTPKEETSNDASENVEDSNMTALGNILVGSCLFQLHGQSVHGIPTVAFPK